jgi:hypothetical protein
MPITPEVIEARRQDRNSAILDLLTHEWQSLKDICWYGARVGTVRASLKRLLADGRVIRRWEGKMVYGYVYRIPMCAAETE